MIRRPVSSVRRLRGLAVALGALAASCSTTPPPAPQTAPPAPVAEAPAPAPEPAPLRVTPPTPGPARDVRLPAIRRSRLPNGLEVNAVSYTTLPVLHIRLTVRAGSSHDPANLPGVASLTGDMLKEGARGRTSAQIAEAIAFVGGSIGVTTAQDGTTFSISVLKDHAETAFTLLADILTTPTFPPTELEKLRRRELDRLERSVNDPGWLSRRAYYQALYPAGHPYARIDTSAEVLRRITRNDIVAFHRARYVAGAMSLSVVGNVTDEQLTPLLTRTLGRVRRGEAPALRFPEAPAATGRQVILIDRPGSAQSVIRVGNLALRRRDDDWTTFSVANQLLGGGVSSRLFMDLRELRSLTYGAYARASENVGVGSWFAGGQVRNAVTVDALQALMQHLECLTTEASPDDELAQTRRYLIDSFPLSIETPGNVADLVSALRLYDLPDDYFDTFRTRVAEVTPATALASAQRYIRPQGSVVIVVGVAEAPVEVGPACAALSSLPAEATFAQRVAACAARQEGAPARTTRPLQEALRAFGPVRVVDLQGRTVRELAASGEALTPALAATCAELTTPALQRVAHASQEASTGH